MNDIAVLLTGAGAPGAPGIIKCLRKNGERNIRIVGVDMNENAAGRKLVDAFYQVPAGKDPAFIDCILDICKKEGVQVVMPLVTRELEKFSKYADLFSESEIAVSVMDHQTLLIVNNKVNLLTTMRDLGMATPEFIPCKTADEVEVACKALGYPQKAVCVKGAEGNGSRGVRLIDYNKSHYDLFFNEKPNSMYMSYQDMMQALREKPDIPQMMVMEYLPNAEYSVDILADHGRVIYSVCRAATEVFSSNMVAGSIVSNEYIAEICANVVQKLKLDGNIGFDLKENENNIPLVMEINPRLTSGVVLCAVGGVNFPYLRIKQLLGEELPQIKAIEGFMMQRRYQEIFFSPDGEEIAF